LRSEVSRTSGQANVAGRWPPWLDPRQSQLAGSKRRRVFELLAKDLSGLDNDEIRNVLLATGKGAAFLAGKPN
jgi:hypothetical protein